jgi:DNA-binding transcriptional ArsR family regulator
MIELIAITKALADENRLRIIAALEGRELCVCQLIALLDLAPSTVSKHLSILKNAHLIQGRKDGRWMYCRLAVAQAPDAAKGAMNWLLENIKDKPRILADRQRLEQIMKTDPDVLCRRQSRGHARSNDGKG